MTESEIRETLSCLLVQVAKAHRRRAGDELAKLGLHVGQEMVLMSLWQQDGRSQSELVCCLQVEPPTLSKMLDRLEKAELVQRRRDCEDARVCRIYLTDAGRALETCVGSVWKTLDEQLLAHLTLEEKLLLRRLLLQMRDNIS